AYHTFNDQVVVGEWRKIEITTVSATNSSTFQFSVPMCVLWLPQVEQGPVATSPIITEADPVTPASDNLSLDDLQSKAWFGDTMTWVIDLTPTSIGNSILLGSTPFRIFGMVGGTIRYGVLDGENTTGADSSLFPIIGERRKLAVAYDPASGEMKI